jgi:hypothetical protein
MINPTRIEVVSFGGCPKYQLCAIEDPKIKKKGPVNECSLGQWLRKHLMLPLYRK